MRRLLATLACVIPMQAYANDSFIKESYENPTQYDALYKNAYDALTALGVKTTSLCFKGENPRCDTSMVYGNNINGYLSIIVSIWSKTNVQASSVCKGWDGADRRCAYSNGVVEDEHVNPTTNEWDTVRVLSTGFGYGS